MLTFTVTGGSVNRKLVFCHCESLVDEWLSICRKEIR